MDTALYYTLSTVSQTLAGAMGVLAAFVLIRLSALNSAIAERVRYLYENLQGDLHIYRESLGVGGGEKVLAQFRAQFDKEVKDSAAEHRQREQGFNNRTEAHLLEGEAMLASRRRLLEDTTRSVIATVVVIGVALIGLLFGPALLVSPTLYWIVCGGAVVGAVGVLGWYIKLVKTAVS